MKNLPKIQVLQVSEKTPTETLINDALLVHTNGDSLAVAPPVTDTVIQGQANTLQTMYTGSKATPPTYTSGEVEVQKKIVVVSYNKIALYLKGVATDAANAAGDVNAGNIVVTRCGFKLKKLGVKPPKTFDVVSKTPGSADVTSKAAGKRAAYRRQYGITTAKGVAPTVLSDDVFTLEVDVHIDNLQSGKIYGFRETSILPIARKKKTGTGGATVITPPATERSTTPTTSNKANKVSFSDGATHYIYSDWIYVVIK